MILSQEKYSYEFSISKIDISIEILNQLSLNIQHHFDEMTLENTNTHANIEENIDNLVSEINRLIYNLNINREAIRVEE